MHDDLARYHRQMLLPGIGVDGQRRLRGSTALLLGCGALGCVVADQLARAGVGHLVIVDRDFIDPTNLQRQVLFDERDVADGLPKAEAARRRLASINSGVTVTAIVDDLNHTSIERHAAGADVLVDGLDNLETRYLANDLAVKSARPYVYGAAVGTTGMALPILPHAAGAAAWEDLPGGSLATPCFRCLFEEAPPPGANATCDTVGILNSVAAIVGSFQAAETLKILTGHFAQVSRRLLLADLWSNDLQWLDLAGVHERADCPCCRHRRFEYLDGRAGSQAVTLCGRNAVQLRHRQAPGSVDLRAVAERLGRSAVVHANDYLLRATLTDQGGEFEITLFADGRAIVKGTDRPEVARSLYARHVGS